MQVKDKTRKQQIRQLAGLHHQITELEALEAGCREISESLLEFQNEYYNFFKASRDALYITNRDGRFVEVNQSFLNLLGYTREELANLRAQETYANYRDRQRFQRDIEQRGFVVDYAIRLRKKDGTELSCLVSATVRRGNDGSVLGYQGIIRDITEYKLMTQKIRENARRYQELADLLPLAVFETDEIGNFFFINRQGFEISGYTPEDIDKGLNGLHLVIPEDQDRVTEDMRSVLSGEKLYGREYIGLRKDGSTYPALIYTNPIIVDQRAVGVRGVAIDVTERKKVEEELQESKERFRSLVEATSDLIWEVDQNGVYTYASPKIKDLLGYEPEEIIGKTPFDLMPADEAERVGAIFRDIKSSQRPFERMENINLHKDGRRIVLETSGVPIFDENANLLGYRGIDRNITARKQMERNLQESRLHYRTLFESAPVGIGIATLDGVVLAANKAMCQITGYSEADMGKLNVRDAYENSEQRTLLLKRLQRGEVVQDLEVKLKRKDGTFYYANLTIKPITLSGEDVLLTIQRDITERKQAEEEIKMLSAVVEQSTEGMAIAGLDGNLTFINEAWCRMHGYKSSEKLLGKSLAIFHNQEQMENEVKPFNEKVIELGAYSGEVGHITRDGKPFPTLMATTLLKDKQGKPYALAGIAQDITERKEAEKKLLNYQQQLRSLASKVVLAEEGERRRIATYLHDDIGHALAMCKIKLGPLKKSLSSAGHDSNLGEVYSLIEQAIECTRSLTFELSPPVLYELGLGAAVEWLIEKVKAEHGILIDFENDALLEIVDEDIKILLFQTMRELLTNVVKHAKAQNAKVSMWGYDGKIQISVKDDGVGFNASQTLSNLGNNAGFGLFDIRERLSHMGGHCDIQSHPGCGTSVTLVAPLESKV
jgi:PAS domain S-box-containing protein